MAQDPTDNQFDDAYFSASTGGAGGVDPAQFQRYLQELRDRLARGESINASEIPLDYSIKTGQLLEKSWWEKYGADVLGTLGIVGLGVGGGLILGGAGAGAGTAAGLGGVEAGAVSGLSPYVASGGLMGTVPGAIGGSTLGKIGSMLGKAGVGVGTAIGDAATAAGQNALDQEQAGLTAGQQNIYGQSAFETELLNRAKLEDTQRQGAAEDIYRQSYAANPRVSPFDPRGAPTYSPEYLAALSNLEKQGSERLATAPQYGTNVMDPLKPYTPIDIKDVQGATGTKPGTLQKVGTWLGPTLTVAEKIALGLM